MSDFDARQLLALGDWVKFESRISDVWPQSLSLRLSSKDTPSLSGGPKISFTGIIDFCTVNANEVDTKDQMLADIEVSAVEEMSPTELGFCSYRRTTKVGEIAIGLELELSRDTTRDIIDHLKQWPSSVCLFAGSVIRLPTSNLPNLIQVLEFGIEHRTQ